MEDLSPHYRKLRVEPREYGEANHLGFSQTNIVKYATRYPFKDGAKDLKKVIECAAWLLKHEYDVTTYYEFSDDQREQQPSASVAPAPSAGKPRKKADAPKPKKNTGNTKPRTAAQLEALKRGARACGGETRRSKSRNKGRYTKCRKLIQQKFQDPSSGATERRSMQKTAPCVCIPTMEPADLTTAMWPTAKPCAATMR